MIKIIAVFVVVLAVFSDVADAKPFSSRQLLPPKPGYVPVYIRNGDTPLEDINLELAEAFHAISSGRSASGKDIMAKRPKHNEGLVRDSKKDDKTDSKNLNVEVLEEKVLKENHNVDKPNEILYKEDEKNIENKSRKSPDVLEAVQKQ